MGFLAVFIAAAAAFGLGAAWYMALSRPWLAATGVAVGPDGRPADKSLAPFILSAVAMLAVSGMMRHMFGMAGIDTLAKGIVSGLGLGAFVALPWIVINYAYAGRPKVLTLIDGGYAVLGCTLIGAVLTLF